MHLSTNKCSLYECTCGGTGEAMLIGLGVDDLRESAACRMTTGSHDWIESRLESKRATSA